MLWQASRAPTDSGGLDVDVQGMLGRRPLPQAFGLLQVHC
jgi:hypothetical protein